MKTEWDEKNYSENFSFVHEYGEKILELITVPNGSYVVDLGCGNGALSAKLAEKYRVTGIDSSYEMLQAAKSHILILILFRQMPASLRLIIRRTPYSQMLFFTG